jgi:hypothetical protein
VLQFALYVTLGGELRHGSQTPQDHVPDETFEPLHGGLKDAAQESETSHDSRDGAEMAYTNGERVFVGKTCKQMEVCATVSYGESLALTLRDEWFVPSSALLP